MAARKVTLGAKSNVKSGNIYRKQFPFEPNEQNDTRQIAKMGSGIDKRKPAADEQPMLKPINTKIKASPVT